MVLAIKEKRICPFRIEMNCQYQETYTQDGDLILICTLAPGIECPKLTEMSKLWD